MSFDVSADSYGRFMGRYSSPLASAFVAHVGVQPGDRVLDVGCGPGALTEVLLGVVGRDRIAATDPSSVFVNAYRDRWRVPVVAAVAERLPFASAAFDCAIAQLVVHFMTDPVAGLREMARVTRRGGRVAANVWDYVEGGSPLSLFWRAATDLDSSVVGEQVRAGSGRGQLTDLATKAGWNEVTETDLAVMVEHADFDEWWTPYTLGVGPAGQYVAGLTATARDHLRDRCRELLPDGPFTVTARAWTVVGAS